MSNDVHYIDTIMDYQPGFRRILWDATTSIPITIPTLGLDFFRSCTRRFKSYGPQTAAFVTSRRDTFGLADDGRLLNLSRCIGIFPCACR